MMEKSLLTQRKKNRKIIYMPNLLLPVVHDHRKAFQKLLEATEINFRLVPRASTLTIDWNIGKMVSAKRSEIDIDFDY